jgi:hypothetical protein
MATMIDIRFVPYPFHNAPVGDEKLHPARMIDLVIPALQHCQGVAACASAACTTTLVELSDLRDILALLESQLKAIRATIERWEVDNLKEVYRPGVAPRETA